MKKGIYDYWTGELIKESTVSSKGGRRLNEEVDVTPADGRVLLVIDKSASMMGCVSELAARVQPYVENAPVDILAFDTNIYPYFGLSWAEAESLITDGEFVGGNGTSFSVVDRYMIRNVNDGDYARLILVTDPSGIATYGGLNIIDTSYFPEKVAIIYGEPDARTLEILESPYIDAIVEVVECGAADTNESVSSRFAKYRALYEDEDINISEEDEEEEKPEESGDDAESDSSDENSDEKSDDAEEGDEDVDIKTVVLTVPNGKGEACKDQMTGKSEVDGMTFDIPEDAIEVIEGEDGDDDKVKVDSEYILDLKDYLSHKTMDGEKIDLEKILGIEIVDDSEESGDEGESDGSDEGTSPEEAQAEIDNFSFDDLGDQDWLSGADEEK